MDSARDHASAWLVLAALLGALGAMSLRQDAATVQRPPPGQTAAPAAAPADRLDLHEFEELAPDATDPASASATSPVCVARLRERTRL